MQELSLSLISTAILVGLLTGTAVSALLAVYFVLSRPYRMRRNPWALGMGYLAVVGMVFAGGSLMKYGLLNLGAHEKSALQIAAGTYAIVFSFGVFFIVRAEMRYRKSMTD